MQTRRVPYAFGFLVALALILAACNDEVRVEGTEDVEFPTGTVTFIVPFGPGGATDNFGREFAPRLEGVLGERVVVENHEGGGGSVGTTETIRSEPDGHTLGLTAVEMLALQPTVNPDLPFQSVDDYTVLTYFTHSPAIMVVAQDSEWESFEQVLTAAAEQPGEINVGTTGAFALAGIVTAQINRDTDAEFNAVHFDGGAGDAMTSLLGGHIDTFITSPGSAMPLIRDGELRPLMVFTDEPFEALPDTEIISEFGVVPEFGQDLFLIAPPNVDASSLAQLEAAVCEVMSQTDFQEWMEDQGVFVQDDTCGVDVATERLVEFERQYASIYEFMSEVGQ